MSSGTQLDDVIVPAILERLNDADDRPDDVPETVLEQLFDIESETALPSCILFVVKESVTKPPALGPDAARVRMREAMLEFEVRAGVTNDLSARQACEPIRAWLIRRLASWVVGDRVTIALEEVGADWLYEGLDLAYCLCLVRFTVTYLTRVNDPAFRT